jgi:hypothetical protein
MTAGLLLGMATGFGLGWWLGKQRKVEGPAPDLGLLEERLQHARNVSMRLGELAEHQKRLTAESSHLEQHLQLREGVAWMLLRVQHEMHACNVDSNPEEIDRVERLLSSMSKSLRLLIDVGRTPVLPWGDLQPVAQQVHQTLCLIQGQKPEQNTQKRDSLFTDFECLATNPINQLINLAAAEKMPATFPFVPGKSGLLLHPQGAPGRTYSWASVPS